MLRSAGKGHLIQSGGGLLEHPDFEKQKLSRRRNSRKGLFRSRIQIVERQECVMSQLFHLRHCSCFFVTKGYRGAFILF